MRWILFPLLLVSLHGFSQCKSYRLSAMGDTLNCTDRKNLKQGKWVIRVETLRGEPGYEEEGTFKNDKKEGPWRRYTLMGDFIALENYRWGHQDGMSQYYNIAGLEHVENWRAINPDQPFDTIDVPDVYDQMKVERKVIKREGSSYKNGIWTYYRPGSLSILRTETYIMDKLQRPKVVDSEGNEVAVAIDTVTTKKAGPKPAQVMEFEKKNSGKKAVKVRDGKTGG